ncbi:DUF2341 domain-containing protein [Microbacterium halotolerans]|uniref:DUF2341 domain-containing protein n=1 Tax=Microbacterium halotolerans TaxID=246613 RepID=UPI0013C2C491|nr:DUF2341 domain-containing protein [Microbacterium halotolerans]
MPRTVQQKKRHELGAFALAAAVVGALVAPMIPTAAVAAAPDGIEGEGIASDPYQIDSPEDLRSLTEWINADLGARSASHIDVVDDIDMADEAPLRGFDTFTGVLDGQGHTISDLVYGGRPPGNGRLALIQNLKGGTVANLTLDGLSADNGTSTGWVGGIAALLSGGTVRGNSVINAELTGTSSDKVAGLVAQAEGGTIIDNYVDATVTAAKMPGGVSAYSKNATMISRNLVVADLTVLNPGGPNGTRGNVAGFVVCYPGTPNSSVYSNNVALSGSIDYDGKADGFVGRIAGYTAYDGWTATDNLASTDITIGGAPVTGPGTKNQNGTDAAPADLAQQSTYESLGWDFSNVWSWDAALGHPVPKYTYTLNGAGTEDAPFEVATASDLEFLAEQLNADNARYTDATHFALAADLDFSDRAPFAGIDQFTAVLEGQGHTISNIVYAPSASSPRLGLIRELRGGSIRDLVLDGVAAHSDSTSESDYIAGLAVIATDARIEGVSIIDADLRAAGAEKAAGLAAELRGASRVQHNWVDGSVTAKKMPAGITSYAHDSTVIHQNLLSVTVAGTADGGSGTRGINAALVVAYPGSGNNIEISGNVAFSGEVDFRGTAPGFAGRILGYYQTSGAYRVPTLSKNLANAEITVGGSPVTGTATDQHGADMTGAALGEQATYEENGWDFAQDWTFDAALGHPIPKFVHPSDLPDRITTTFFGDPGTQRAFTWYSKLGETGSVQLSLSRDLSDPVTIDAERKTSQDGETFYQAVATDLTAGERYFYRVGDPDSQNWSNIGTFVTSDGESDFTFIDLTDSQSQNISEAELSAATMSKALATIPSAEFLMHNGDVVEHGEREQDWSDLLNSAQSSLLATTIAPVAGNHDQATNAFVDHFALEAPNGQNTAKGAYYSFDYNDAHFAMLNTNEDGAQSVSDAQIEWLREDVTQARERGAQWIIVTMHKGMYTTANHLDDGDIIAMRDALVPLIDELDIDLVLQGHDHVMSRSKQLISDPNGVENAAVVETDVITEIVGGKRTEYTVDPEGTIYFLPNTSGAKHYRQATSASSGIDLEAYLQLFDRTGEQSTENFVAVNVTEGRLTVDVYDIRDKGQPRLFESFGIDREITPVDAQIDALPGVDELTASDADAVATVRTSIDALSSAQQSGLTQLEDFLAREARMRELTGAVATDGSEIAWAATDAERRQAITVGNSTRSTFSDVPVRLELTGVGEDDPSRIAFTTNDGVPMPFEVETWNPNGTSVVWVRVPEARSGATTIWAYYGTDDIENDPAAVWAEDYALVEHFGTAPVEGEALVDSTGTRRGELVGGEITVNADDGDGTALLGEGRLQYTGDVGGQQDRIAISSVVSLTAEQLTALDGNAPIVAKEPKGASGLTTFSQEMVAGSGQLSTRLAGNAFQMADVDLKHRFDFPVDGEKHLVTQVYDGMTYSVFVDGEEVHSELIEYRSTYGDPSVPTTIGDYYTADGALSSPFSGEISEVQIAGVAFRPDLERFRYEHYLGDAVSYSDVVARSDEKVTLVVESPSEGDSLEAGLVEVVGTVSQRSEMVAIVAGEEVLRTPVDSGTFTVEVPLNALGEQSLELRAEAAGSSATAQVQLDVSDTTAPKRPEVSDDASSARGEDAEVTLTVSPDSDDREQLTTTLFANATVPLTAENTVVRTGTSTDRTPEAITPDSGTATASLLPTTVGDDANPYQIYTITLTEEQAVQDQLHFAWKGRGDQRRVSAHIWDATASAWTLSGAGSSNAGEEFSLDITAGAEAISAERTVTLLIWRGLASSPWADGTDYTAEPDVADYDWGLDHVPDTQLYAQAYPDLMADQFQYMVDRSEERDTRLIVHAGDLVNREFLSQEYQWHNAEKSVRLWEDAAIPYLVSWGNHDYSDSRNNRVMLPKYYPMDRFAAAIKGSEWSFGGSHSIDNYYYTGEVDGANLLVLTLGFFSSNNAGDAGLGWAADVIASHPDHTVILAMHDSVKAGANRWANKNITDRLIAPYSNVQLVLGGHIRGTGVASYSRDDGSMAYGILTDYQGRVYGGQEYLRHLSFDAENGLLYANTYSPLLDKTTSDGIWHRKIDETKIPGFHGTDSENFVLELDLGGTTTRSVSTSGLSLAVGDPVQVGAPVTSIGDEQVEMVLTGATAGVEYEWYADLEDAAGNITRSPVSVFTVATSDAERPSVPQDVNASAAGADTVRVSWAPPAQDGGSMIVRYEVAVGAQTTTVDGSTLSTDVSGLAAGTHEVTVRAENVAGWSELSAPVEVELTGDETPTPSISVTGSFVPGGTIQVNGSGFSADTEYALELHSDPVALGTVTTDAAGTLDGAATIPASVTAGVHDVAVMQDDAIIASAQILISADSGSHGDDGTGETDVPNEGLGGHLPETGDDLAWLGWVAGGAVLLLALGGVFVIRRRRLTLEVSVR